MTTKQFRVMLRAEKRNLLSYYNGGYHRNDVLRFAELSKDRVCEEANKSKGKTIDQLRFDYIGWLNKNIYNPLEGSWRDYI
jgi:hypothetical protein